MQSTLRKEKIFFTGFFLIVLLAIILLLSSITFFAGGKVMFWHFPIALILTGAATYFVIRNQVEAGTKNIFYISTVSSLLIIVVSILIAGSFYDVSYDGQAYHQETLIQLKNGWNPYFQTLPTSVNQSLYINHYAKGAEIPQSVIYAFSDKIETGKATNLILFAGSFLITLSLMLYLNIISFKKALLFSLLLASNPISINQILSYYVDGQLATLLLCLIVTGILLVKKVNASNLLLLAAVIIITANIKFTAVLYVSIYVLALIAWFVYSKQLVKSKKVFWTALIAGFLGLAVGFNPYITNTVQYHHPFYPLMGEGKIDIMSYNLPKGFEGKSFSQKLFISLFSHTDNVKPNNGKIPVLKIPFTVNKKDLMNSFKIDARIAGFGPLFSGILVVSIIVLLLLYFTKNNRRLFKNLIYILLILITSVLVIPESWWARYVPQLWIFPIMILLVAEVYSQKFLFLLKKLLYISIAINIGFTFIGIAWNILLTAQINYQMSRLKSAHETIVVQWADEKSNRIRFAENNVKYKEQNLDGVKSELIIHSYSKFLPLKTASESLVKPAWIKWVEIHIPQ